MNTPPMIIQGGMGVAVSGWRLARAVSELGQLGVVSGTGIDTVLVRRLQDGDPGGHVRRAIERFPMRDVAASLLDRYFRPGGREPGQPYLRLPLATVEGNRLQRGALMVGTFVETFLAKEGHDRPVGMNLLTKIQLATLPSLYGAMLAGVDWILMGAGIPMAIPGALDRLARNESASLRIDVANAERGDPPVETVFDPAEFGSEQPAPLRRPGFLPIVASHSLASMLIKRASGSIEGFIIEGPTAGGHNAPPRGGKTFDELGQPVYGERDVVDLDKLRELDRPFWLAGGTGSPQGLRDALDQGATGIQVGTLFAFCDESGLTEEIKRDVRDQVRSGRATVRTDPRASPTGFPFKVVSLEGTNSEPDRYEDRGRVCDLGYLREVYRTPTGQLGYRCASEPVDAYLAKGGEVEDTVGRKCLCNALLADVGRAQVQKGGEVERPLVTSGDDLTNLGRFLPSISEGESYTAADVVRYLLGR
ncbi:MAG: nitronate monooxygenase [Trueperaceae bacterium]|nr:nitronate monooxygenase [Trueperaceae bacterium]